MKPTSNPESKISPAATTTLALIGALTTSVADNAQAAVDNIPAGPAPIVQAHSSEHTIKLDAFTSFQDAFKYCVENKTSMSIHDQNHARVILANLQKKEAEQKEADALRVKDALSGKTSAEIAAWCKILPENEWATKDPYKTLVTTEYAKVLKEEEGKIVLEQQGENKDVAQQGKPVEAVKPKPALGSKEDLALKKAAADAEKAKADAEKETARIAKMAPKLLKDFKEGIKSASKWTAINAGADKVDTKVEITQVAGKIIIKFPKNGNTLGLGEFIAEVPAGSYDLTVKMTGGPLIYWHGDKRLELKNGETTPIELAKPNFKLGGYVTKTKPVIEIEEIVLTPKDPKGNVIAGS